MFTAKPPMEESPNSILPPCPLTIFLVIVKPNPVLADLDNRDSSIL